MNFCFHDWHIHRATKSNVIATTQPFSAVAKTQLFLLPIYGAIFYFSTNWFLQMQYVLTLSVIISVIYWIKSPQTVKDKSCLKCGKLVLDATALISARAQRAALIEKTDVIYQEYQELAKG